MASLYQSPLYPRGSGGFQSQDGVWDNSVSMERSDSQSTSCTIDSSYTISTSGHSSATDYSSVDSAFTAGGKWQEASSYPDPGSFFEYPDTNHMLATTGSQYQETGHQLPQALHLSSPLQPLTTRAGIEEAARQATMAANILIINQQSVGDGGPSFITSEAVEEALQWHQDQGTEEPVRPAVQDVLYRQLYPCFSDIDHSSTDISRILEEAAYQLQIRLQGPNVLGICFYAILTILVELTTDPGTAETNASSSGSVDVHNPHSTAAQ